MYKRRLVFTSCCRKKNLIRFLAAKTNNASKLVDKHTGAVWEVSKKFDVKTHTCRRFDTISVDASLIVLSKLLSRWNGNVNMIAIWLLLLSCDNPDSE